MTTRSAGTGDLNRAAIHGVAAAGHLAAHPDCNDRRGGVGVGGLGYAGDWLATGGNVVSFLPELLKPRCGIEETS